MFLDVAGRPLSPPTNIGWGLGDWIALGLTLALFVFAFIVPTVIANRASRSRAPRTGRVQPKPTGTVA